MVSCPAILKLLTILGGIQRLAHGNDKVDGLYPWRTEITISQQKNEAACLNKS